MPACRDSILTANSLACPCDRFTLCPCRFTPSLRSSDACAGPTRRAGATHFRTWGSARHHREPLEKESSRAALGPRLRARPHPRPVRSLVVGEGLESLCDRALGFFRLVRGLSPGGRRPGSATALVDTTQDRRCRACPGERRRVLRTALASRRHCRPLVSIHRGVRLRRRIAKRVQRPGGCARLSRNLLWSRVRRGQPRRRSLCFLGPDRGRGTQAPWLRLAH